MPSMSLENEVTMSRDPLFAEEADAVKFPGDDTDTPSPNVQSSRQVMVSAIWPR